MLSLRVAKFEYFGGRFLGPFMKLVRIFALFVAGFTTSTCTVLDKHDDTPSFIRIEDIGVHTREPRSCPTCEGSESDKIIDAWVLANGKSMGVFELPATVPIPYSGETDIIVGAGISLNGFLETREQYAFFQPYRANINLTPGATTDFSEDSIASEESWKRSFPVVQYFEDIVFFNEDFQQAGFSIENGADADTVVESVSGGTQAFVDDLPGEPRSAAVYLTEDRPFYEGILTEEFEFPLNARIFVEVNYRSNLPIEFGFYTLGGGSSDNRTISRGIKPSTEWNKIYLELTQDIQSQIQASGFRIFFQTYMIDGVSAGEVYIDNVKVIYPDI